MKKWSISFLVSIVALGFGCQRKSGPTGLAEPVPRKTNPNSVFATHWQDETQFVVEFILRDLVEMVHHAAGKAVPAVEQVTINAREKRGSAFRAPTYALEITWTESELRPITQEMPVDRSIWDPSLYAPLAVALTSQLKLDGSVPSSAEVLDDALLRDLADYNTLLIEKWNKRISGNLQQDFLDSAAHESAALLLGIFALREHSGYFHEVRTPLNRMTAHLVIADVLRGDRPRSLNGVMALALLPVLTGNQTDAVTRLSALPESTATVPWKRALRAIVTRDYRELTTVQKPTILERLARLEAEGQSIDLDTAWHRIDDKQVLNMVDFVRLAGTMKISVEMGHELSRLLVPLEHREVTEYLGLAGIEPDSSRERVLFLNEWPDRAVTAGGQAGAVAVLGPGLWAGHFQRQLGHALYVTANFFERGLGIHEEAEKFARAAAAEFSQLNYWPLMRRLIAYDTGDFHQATDQAVEFAVQHPHLMPAMCWNSLYWRTEFAAQYLAPNLPDVSTWHKHNPPPFTAYDSRARLSHISLVRRPDTPDQLRKLLALAPENLFIADELVKTSFGPGASYDQIEPIYRPMIAYSAHAVDRLARSGGISADAAERLVLTQGENMPALYLRLGNQFVGLGDDEKAAKYLELGIEKSKDAVLASNHAPWLVLYYHRTGQKQKAHRLADFAAEVYSYAGLKAKADLLYAEKDYDQALRYCQLIDERYGDPSEVITFGLNHARATGLKTYDSPLQAALKRMFPRGMQEVRMADFSGPPVSGVRIDSENERTRAATLQAGNIVVAINGIAVANEDQWVIARNMGPTNEVNLIVWNGQSYRAVTASPPKLTFGVELNAVNPGAK